MMAEDKKPEAEDKPKQADDSKPEAKGKPDAKDDSKPSAKGPKRKKVRASSDHGKLYIQSTFNNTIMSFTDASGQVLTWGSPGTAGFKGTRKSTPYASTVAAQQAAERAKQTGLKSVEVLVRGVGSGREAAIRALQSSGIQVTSLKDMTPMPHNGVRAKKPRRV